MDTEAYPFYHFQLFPRKLEKWSIKKGENVLGAITNRGVSPFIFKDKTSEQSKTKLKEEKKFILQSFV